MFKKILAENVKQIRTKRGMSQEQLAAKSSLSVRYCQHIEAGTKAASVITVFKVAKALDTDYTTLLAPVWLDWLQQPHADGDPVDDE